MTLAWKRTVAEWARFSKAVISGETGRERENLSNALVRGQASLVTILPCSPYSSDVCKGQQGTKEIRFGTNRSRCFLKHSNMRRDSDCQRYWVYLRTSAYLPLRWIYWMRDLTCVGDTSIMALYSAMQLVRKHLTSASSSVHFSFYLFVVFSLPPFVSFLIPFQYKRKYQAHSPALPDVYINTYINRNIGVYTEITSDGDITYSMKTIASLATLFIGEYYKIFHKKNLLDNVNYKNKISYNIFFIKYLIIYFFIKYLIIVLRRII